MGRKIKLVRTARASTPRQFLEIESMSTRRGTRSRSRQRDDWEEEYNEYDSEDFVYREEPIMRPSQTTTKTNSSIKDCIQREFLDIPKIVYYGVSELHWGSILPKENEPEQEDINLNTSKLVRFWNLKWRTTKRATHRVVLGLLMVMLIIIAYMQ